MGVPSGRALYVGDILSVDAAGARAAGMHFVLLDPLGDYAAGRVPAIPAIDRLPQYLREEFDVRSLHPAARDNGAARGGG
jgi:FMN phosphatase YigB (HAD superfamily)